VYGCITHVHAGKDIVCSKCVTPEFVLQKGDCKRLTGCTNNVLNGDVIECKACEVDYHLFNKKC